MIETRRFVRSTKLAALGGALLVGVLAGCSSAADPAGQAPGVELSAHPNGALNLFQKPNLYGKTDVAFGRKITPSLLSGGNPAQTLELGWQRKIESVGITTSSSQLWGRPSLKVELLDANHNVVKSEPVDTASSSILGTFWVTFDGAPTASSVRVVEDGPGSPVGGAVTEVTKIQAYAQLIPESLFPLSQKVPPPKSGTCWKPTKGRGVGSVPDSCGDGMEKNGALCYPKCAPGYTGVGPVCWEDCPSGWTNTGAFCHQDGDIFSANNSSCPWYDVCGLTFARGCSTCPSGFANDGCTCRRDPKDFAKKSYGRGAGSPLGCAPGLENQAALCYSPCDIGYHGVGPVCWATCGADHPVDCAGVACATDNAACEYSIQNKTLLTIEMIANMSSLAVSFGESAEAISVVKAGGRALSATEQAQLRDVLIKEIRKQATDLAEDAVESAASEGVNAILTGKFDWTAIDPTGIAAVVLAFNQPMC